MIFWPIPRAQHTRFAVSGDKHAAPVKDPERLFTTFFGCRSKEDRPQPSGHAKK